MNHDASQGDRKFDLLRVQREFDQSFATTASSRDSELEGLLALRVGSVLYAVRARETSGLATTVGANAVPSPMPELEGLVGLRGALVPLFRLAALLGSGETLEPSRWVLLIGRDEPIGLGFQEPDGYHKVARAALVPIGEERATGAFVREIANVGTRRLPVLDVPLIVTELQQRIARQRTRKEG
jgi:chemotaxis signal transduction protein